MDLELELDSIPDLLGLDPKRPVGRPGLPGGSVRTSIVLGKGEHAAAKAASAAQGVSLSQWLRALVEREVGPQA